MKIALAQMEVIPGMPEKNLETMLQMVSDAKSQKANLIVFPEMCLGYLLGDKWTETAFCEYLMSFDEQLREASDGIAIAYGNVFLDSSQEGYHPNKDGRIRKYNAVRIFQNQKPVQRAKESKMLPEGVQPKTLLPNYRIFDDERYFFSLQDVGKDFNIPLEELEQPFMIEIDGKKVPIGFELCEDLWCEDYRKDRASINTSKMLIENGAELIVNLSASPWTYGKNSARDRRIKFIKEECGDSFVPFLYVNCTGVQNNGKNIVTFDGGSTVYNSEGKPVKFSREAYKQELIIVDEKTLEGKVLQRQEKPKIEQKYNAIIEGIKKFAYAPYVIGLSGGIDSSVVAALLVQAVGSERVFGVNMPSRYNSQKTRDAAKTLAENLGISYSIIPIEGIVEANQEALDSADLDGSGRRLDEFNLENVQAKIRGTSVLSNLAAKYNALFTNNGNKLEVALGYATLYGDWGGALAPIADLTKTEVVEMAEYLNQKVFGREVIPEKLIPDKLWRFREDQIEPTAELKFKQVDPMKFGYHCALIEQMTDYKKKSPEEIMQWYLNGTLAKNLRVSVELVERWNIDNPQEFVKDLEWFSKLVQKSVFKRVQAPPIIITSKSAYGYDIRESILPWNPTRRYNELKQKVLAMEKYSEVKS